MNLRWALIATMILGGTAFWVPDILISLFTGRWTFMMEFFLRTFAPPSCLAAAYAVIYIPLRRRQEFPSVAFQMLLGTWLMGPLMMHASGFAAGRRYAGLDETALVLISLVIGTVIFPVTTMIMSVYNMSVFAVALGTLSMLSLHFSLERKHPISPWKGGSRTSDG